MKVAEMSLELLRNQRRKLDNERAQIDCEIQSLELRLKSERRRKVPLRPLSYIHNKHQAKEMLRIYPADEIRISDLSRLTLQDKIDEITADIEDCQCSIYFGLISGVWYTIEYMEDERQWRDECARMDADDRWVCVFAK